MKLATPWGEFLLNWNPNSNLAQVFITDLSDNRIEHDWKSFEFPPRKWGGQDRVEKDQ